METSEYYKYRFRSDFQFKIANFPHIIVEVHSKESGERHMDLARLIVQGSCLVRAVNNCRNPDCNRSFVLMGLYISEDLVVSQILMNQPDLSNRMVSLPIRALS